MPHALSGTVWWGAPLPFIASARVRPSHKAPHMDWIGLAGALRDHPDLYVSPVPVGGGALELTRDGEWWDRKDEQPESAGLRIS